MTDLERYKEEKRAERNAAIVELVKMDSAVIGVTMKKYLNFISTDDRDCFDFNGVNFKAWELINRIRAIDEWWL